MYWIYDLPTWLLGLLIVSIFVCISLLGLIASRQWVAQAFRLSDETNEPVNGFFAGVGVMYSLLLGLVAVAAWQNYDSANGIATKEAALIGALYRDVCAFPEPERHELQDRLAKYLHFIVEADFPAHRQGELQTGGTILLTELQGILTAIQPASINQQVMLAEAYGAFNKVIEARRIRMDAVNTGIPLVFWAVILVGAVLSVVLTYVFHLPSLKTHTLLTGLFSLFLGFVIFLVAAMDNPFRGEMSVSPEPYTLVLQSLDDLAPANWNRLPTR
ncbi:MAG: DUF4239 domain-containing protein [Methylococcus sp.]|nr:DUF4239 domain-containing protein [Methylococcus sp.]